MSRLITFPLVIFMFIPCFVCDVEGPESYECVRKHGKLWWERFNSGTKRCEVRDDDENNQECGVCARLYYTNKSPKLGYKPGCRHFVFSWVYDVRSSEGGKFKQTCSKMDHCRTSFKANESMIEKVCGGEKRGKCRSVYGSYSCNCYRPFLGRDCNDQGYDERGEYAKEVVVVVDQRVRVSQDITILIAAKKTGNDFKAKIHLKYENVEIVVTEPIVKDETGRIIKDMCMSITHENDADCLLYFQGSTVLYSVTLRYPLIRDLKYVWYYLDADKKDYPVGYYTSFAVTTTNVVNGLEIETFFRTHYTKYYTVFVDYPIDINCYKNVKILNCKEVQNKVKPYPASLEIELNGDFLNISPFYEVINKEDPLKCMTNGEDTTKWKLLQAMPDGKFRTVYEIKGEKEFHFFIKPYSLQKGLFRVDFINSIMTQWDLRENFDQCYLKVGEEPIIAIIDGGRSKYADVDSVIILDGSRSYDPNLEGNKGKMGLSFDWSCNVQVDGKEGPPCLKEYLSNLGSRNYITLPASILEPLTEYIISLSVSKPRKEAATTQQFIVTGDREIVVESTTDGNKRGNKTDRDGGNKTSPNWILSVGIVCINCMENNFANPREFIYLLAQIVFKPNMKIEKNTNLLWTFSIDPAYPPTSSTSDIRVNKTSEELFKIDKNKLADNKTYWFRTTVGKSKFIYSDIDIRTPFMKKLECSLTPDSGIVAVTKFSLNCNTSSEITYEAYDKSPSDPKYFSGRMLFTGVESYNFTLSNQNFVVYGYNEFKMTQEWNSEVKLQAFDGQAKDIYDMVHQLLYLNNPQRLLHSASIIPVPVTPDMDWQSLLKSVISVVYETDFSVMQHRKLALSSIEFIFVVLTKKELRLTLEVEEGYQCAVIIFSIIDGLSANIENFDRERTLTETIFHQMIRSSLNVIELVLATKCSKVKAKPLYLVNPYVLRLVKKTSFKFVDALYKMSSYLLCRQIQGDSATEIISNESKISMWALVHSSEELYRSRIENESIPFQFSPRYNKTIQHLDTIGIQVTTLSINPFWWAGGNIDTNILLVDHCLKVNLTECKYQRAFYRAPIYLYFNISEKVNLIKPLELYTWYFNFSQKELYLDLAVTVYRFDPPLRSMFLIEFEFGSSPEDYIVLFQVNKRPDFETMKTLGIRVNNENQSLVQHIAQHYKREERDKLYYMGIMPANEGGAGMKSKFKLKIIYVKCKTWLRWRWGGQRCWVGDKETNERTLRCDCNHLSMFAGSVRVPLYQLNPAMEFMLFLTEEFNWLPLLLLILILILFILFYIWGRRCDKQDSNKGIVIILEDNYPGDMSGYLLGVYTGSRIDSSTDANVGIKLLGEDGESRAHILKSRTQRTLQGNSDDWFLIYSPEPLGTLSGLQIWHDNTGKSPSWFVERIDVFDLSEKCEYIFELNIWLALNVDEYPEVFVYTSSIDEFYSVRRVFISNLLAGLRDTHYWTSIFLKHARNPIHRVLRISVVLCYTMAAMGLSVTVYMFNKGKEYREDEPAYRLNKSDFIIFTIILLVASFTSCLVMFLFRKSFSHKYKKMQSSLFLRPEDITGRRSTYFAQRQSEDFSSRLSMFSLYDSTQPEFLELSNKHLDERFIRFGLRGKLQRERSTYEKFAAALHAIVRGSTLEPVRLPKYKKSLVLHWTYLVPGWLLCIAIVTVSAIIVIIFGHQITKVVSEKWVTIFLCALICDALILSTIKVIFCSTVLACAFQRTVPASNYQLNNRDGTQKRLIGDLDHLLKLERMRNDPMYCPLTDQIKEMYRQKRIKIHNWRILIDFCVVFMLVWVVGMLTTLIVVDLYESNNQAILTLTQSHYLGYRSFKNIFNRTHYSDFLFYNLVDQLHRFLWYTQEDPLEDKDEFRGHSWTYGCTMRLLGRVRIRQSRVKLGECSQVKYFEDLQEYCSPSWSSSVEDTGTYGSNWRVGGYEDVKRKSTAWRYTDEANSNSSVSYGPTLNFYPSGGFIDDLGYDKDVMEDVLTNFRIQNWLDHMTRAVFVELTLYNVNTGLFSQVTLIAEQMPTGVYLVSAKAESVTTEFSLHFWNVTFSIFFLFFLVRMCILMNRNGICVYLTKILNVFEVFLLGLGLLTLIFYIIHTTTSSEYVQEYQRRGIDEFFSFSKIITYRLMSRAVLCILFACGIIRLLMSWRFGRIYFTFYYTLFLSLPWIVWLVTYLILYLVVIWRFVGYLLNLFVFPFYSSVIIHYKNFFSLVDDSFRFKVLIYVMCLCGYVNILLFIASFAYHYKVAKVYKLIDTDSFNMYAFMKEFVKSRFNKNSIRK